MKHNDQLMATLIQSAMTCERCATSILAEPNIKGLEHCIKINRDCADISLVTARLMERESDVLTEVLELCAHTARRCAESCERHLEISSCKVCAESCRRLEEACQSFFSEVAGISK